MSLIETITDDVVTELNRYVHVWRLGDPNPEDFTAVRAYVVSFDLQQLRTLQVTVVPKSAELGTVGRRMVQTDLQIDIGVQRKLTTNDDIAEIDGLLNLVEGINNYLRTKREFADAIWVKSEIAPLYSLEHLIESRLFTSVITVTLRAVTSL